MKIRLLVLAALFIATKSYAAPDNVCAATMASGLEQATNKNLQYVKAEQYLVDFKKFTKTHVGTVYATRERKLAEKKMLIVGYTKQGTKNIVTKLGTDLMSFENVIEGSDQPLDHGRFLDDNYEAAVFAAEMPEKGVRIDAVTTVASPITNVTTKIINKKNADAVVIQEVATKLTASEFRAAVADMCR